MARLVDMASLSAPAAGLRIADFLFRTERERQHLFREHLQTTVRWISPLLLDLAAMEGMVLDNILRLMRPPSHWPWRSLHDFRPSFSRSSPQKNIWLRAAANRDVWHFARSFTDPGLIIRKPNHPDGRFAIRPCRNALDFSVSLGPCILCALGPTAILKLPNGLPESVLMSLPGRVLHEVIEDPIFAIGPYWIKRVLADPNDGLPLLIFRAKLLPFDGPWTGLPKS